MPVECTGFQSVYKVGQASFHTHNRRGRQRRCEVLHDAVLAHDAARLALGTACRTGHLIDRWRRHIL